MALLVKDRVSSTVIRMAVPMLAGTFAMNAYNLVDTWFVSRLGTNALAAMSFTFPVVMLLGFIMRGLGTGAMTVVAHALGRGKQKTAARITTHAAFFVFKRSLGLNSSRALDDQAGLCAFGRRRADLSADAAIYVDLVLWVGSQGLAYDVRRCHYRYRPH